MSTDKVVNTVTGEVDKVDNKKYGIKEYANDGKSIVVTLIPIFSKEEAESLLKSSWYPNDAFVFCVDDEESEK